MAWVLIAFCSLLADSARLDGALHRVAPRLPKAKGLELELIEEAVKPPALDGLGPSIAGTLSLDVLRHVLDFVRRPPQVVSSMGLEPPAIWRSGEPQIKLHGPVGRIVDLKFFPDGGRLITSASGGTSTIWSSWSGNVVHELVHNPVEDCSILEVQVFPDGQSVVTLGSDGTAVVWSAQSGEALVHLSVGGVGDHTAVRVFPDGSRLATGISLSGADAPTVIWEVVSGTALHVLRQGWDAIKFLEVSPCGGMVLTASDEAVRIWNASDGHMHQELFGHAGQPAAGVAISKGGARIVLSTHSGDLFIWDGDSGRLKNMLRGDAGVAACVFLDHGASVATLSRSGLSIWNTDTGERLCKLNSGDTDPLRVAIAGQGEIIAVCGGGPKWWGGQQTTIWDASTCRRLHTMMGASAHRPMWATGSTPCRVAAGTGGSLSDWVVA
mmetsp:Transcript_107825/g.311551  ORF Transcript_107825/g.311551 Transcript_107825/m.311551 type:complete len:439 (+) Transcript_107825:1-1317(+)